MTSERIAYGTDPEQFGVLHLPEGGQARGAVVVIHGGFWKSIYDYELGEPISADLAKRGWAAWNIEYRRLGNGGGNPETFDDIRRAIDHLPRLGFEQAVVIGHSAGGHLAVWAAGAHERIIGAVAQASVLDLTAVHAMNPERSLVARLLGRVPQPDDEFDPLAQAPIGVPVRCVHGLHDEDVPISQARDYVAKSVAGGGDARLVEYDGGHYEHIDPASEAWTLDVEAIEELSRPR